MAALGFTSLSHLQGVKAITLSRANALALIATQHGGDISIPADGGLRSVARQEQLLQYRKDSIAANDNPATPEIEGSYAVGPATGPNASRHLTGDAFDIRVLRNLDGMDNDESYKFLADIAPSIGLKAGYYFPTSDPFHFQNIEGVTADDAAADSPSSRPAGFTTGEVLAALLAALLILLVLR